MIGRIRVGSQRQDSVVHARSQALRRSSLRRAHAASIRIESLEQRRLLAGDFAWGIATPDAKTALALDSAGNIYAGGATLAKYDSAGHLLWSTDASIGGSS